ncbi:hypothetical protein [Saccharibacillus sp. JS10]|uniref:hypothetical protein n=1 Tax=Saccharibacillus sp. JS10 TaxID=2950552 RepID=UPI00210B13B1|nr:hypothetical protein [Saccharibacillus sp. JS10]MCQ4086844.1 hypothetical protein [Saccharibacillus sp. JS10]
MSHQAQRFKEFGRPIAYSLLEALSVYALVILLAYFVFQISDLLLLLSVFVIHAASSIIGLKQAQKSGAAWLTIVPFGTAVVISLIVAEGIWGKSIGAVLLLLIALRGLQVGRQQLWDHILLRIPLVGLSTLLILYIAVGNAVSLANLVIYRSPLYVASIALLVLLLLLANGDRVRNAAREETSALYSVLTMNRRLTWAMSLFIVLAGIIGGPTGLLRSIRDWWLSIFNAATPGEPESPTMAPVDYSALDGLTEQTGEETVWQKIMAFAGQILLGLAAAICVVVVVWILWILIRKLIHGLPVGIRNLISSIAKRFGIMNSVRAIHREETYTDQAEKIAVERQGGFMQRFRRRKREERYTGNDPKLRYRSVLIEASRNGYSLRTSRTPLENGKELSSGTYTELSQTELDQLVERYNQVRYGKEQQSE